jgi:hypothetical protein
MLCVFIRTILLKPSNEQTSLNPTCFKGSCLYLLFSYLHTSFDTKQAYEPNQYVGLCVILLQLDDKLSSHVVFVSLIPTEEPR